MTTDDNIQKIVEFILKNIEKVSSTGLYNGKAGLSLSFFLASEYLQDNNLEDIAFRLLQESIVMSNKDESFENGLAGIGYTLLHLIEYKYLEADFDEIFNVQYETLMKSYENIEKTPLRLLNFHQTILFLSRVSRLKETDDRIQTIIKFIFEGLELFLTVQFQDFADIHYKSRKADVINIYKSYLKLINYVNYNCFSHSLLEIYATLHRNGKIASSLEIGFYLQEIAKKFNITTYDDVVNENISNGIKNIYLDTLSLKERIDLSQIAYGIAGNDITDLLPEIDNILSTKAIRNLLLTVDKNHCLYVTEQDLDVFLFIVLIKTQSYYSFQIDYYKND